MMMMRSFRTFTIATVFGISAIGAAVAEYDTTGEAVTCLPIKQVRVSDAVADDAIIFTLNNGDVYLNKLRGTCIGLARNDRFSYKTTQNQICRGDLLTVANPVGIEMGTCGLGNFEPIAEQTAD